MKARYRLTRRGSRGDAFYCVDNKSGKRTSLHTSKEEEARQIIEAKNNAERQPVLNLQIAKAYLAGSDSGVATRTWQQAFEALNLRPLGIDNTYHFQREEQLKVGPWFNAEPSTPLSCCAMLRPATEFECQGLELDFPIVCWGDDLLWNTNSWAIDETRRRSVQDPAKVTRNAYRVLLTRGRDGMAIFVPPTADSRFASTYNALVAAGCQPL